jgi:hypothetical protein
MRVAELVRVDGHGIVPAGTQAVGEVTQVKRKGAFGNSGKLDVRVLHLDLGENRIRPTGTNSDLGAGGTGATVAVAVVAGLFSAFVTGKSAELPVGTQMLGYMEANTPVIVEALPSLSTISTPSTPANTPVIVEALPSAPPPILIPASAVTPAQTTEAPGSQPPRPAGGKDS